MFNNNYNIFNDLNNSSDDEEEKNNIINIEENPEIGSLSKTPNEHIDTYIPPFLRYIPDLRPIIPSGDSSVSNKSEEFLEEQYLTNDDLDNIEDMGVMEDENEKKYIEPKILENISLNNFFCKDDIIKAKNNNKKLQITDKGLYSITKSDDAVWITNLILKFIKNETTLNPKNTTIIDSTSGIGGNSIHFSKYFNKVNSIEINEIHYNVLKNNIDALNIKNINIYHNNFLNLVNTNKLCGDIFFIDPPWGGKSYKNFKYFFLKIGKLPLINVLNILYESKYKYVVLKAPYNLNISLLVGAIKYDNINIYKNSKKNMLIIIFY